MSVGDSSYRQVHLTSEGANVNSLSLDTVKVSEKKSAGNFGYFQNHTSGAYILTAVSVRSVFGRRFVH